MTAQGTLFAPGSANREEAVPVQARLLTRQDDPATSHEAAKRVASNLTPRQEQALATLTAYGPGTTHQLAWKATKGDLSGRENRATAIHHELARRFPELRRKGLARVQRDMTGWERKENRSRIWEVVP